MKQVGLVFCVLLMGLSGFTQNFTFPISGVAVNDTLPPLESADSVRLVTSIRSTGCTPSAGSGFFYSGSHVSTGAIYRNTSWAAGCIGSTDIIKMDFTTKMNRPIGLRFSIYDVDNGSDSVSVHIYSGGLTIDYNYSLYSPTYVLAFGASPCYGFRGSGSNNSTLDDNSGRIDLETTSLTAQIDSVIIFKYNNRDIPGNPSQSFAAFSWTPNTLLPVRLISFSATSQYEKVYLHWSATNEDGSEEYQLEYSNDASEFRAIGLPHPAKGSANDVSEYHSTVPLPTPSPQHYFRVKIKKSTGLIVYSKLIRVDRNLSQQSTVYPTVFTNMITLSLEPQGNTNGVIRLLGNNGKVHFIKSIQLQNGSNQLLLSLPGALPAGTYMLNGKFKNGFEFRHKLIKL